MDICCSLSLSAAANAAADAADAAANPKKLAIAPLFGGAKF